MAMGLIGAALEGGAQAVNDIADNSLAKKRERALLKLREDMQIRAEGRQNERQDVVRAEDREWQLSDYDMQREDAVEDRDMGFAHDRTLTNIRESGANRRSAANRNDWKITSTSDGTPVRINARTGRIEAIEGSENFNFGGTTELTPREELAFEDYQNRRKLLSEELNEGMASPERAAEIRLELDTVKKQIGRLLDSSGGNGGVNAEVDTAYGGEETPAPGDDGVTPPPGNPDANEDSGQGFKGLINNARAEQQSASEQRQTEREEREIENEINEIRGLAARIGRGPGMSQADRDEAAKEAYERAKTLMEANKLDDKQIGRLEAAAAGIIKYSDIEFE